MEQNHVVETELWGICIDDSKCTAEHRLLCAILLKAVQEATWKRVIITYVKQGFSEERSYFSRCNNAISYLKDTERDDMTSVLNLCELFDIKYENIKKIIDSNPADNPYMEEVHFKFKWTNQGWRLISSHRHQIYGCILRNCMFELKID